MEAEPLGSILSIVPRGFEAYARVFHPVERDRPRETRTWQGINEATLFAAGGDIESALETERATWAAAASSFGTVMHAEAQYARLVRRDYGDTNGMISADGWRYGDTSEGCLDARSLSTVSAVLARHTTTPDTGIAALWDGWGGLLSSAGVLQLVSWPDDDQSDRDSAEEGTVDEDAVGPRFSLHGDSGRRYILFEVGATDLAHDTWPTRAPWVDRPTWAPSPSILWPEDHAWVLATEIDFDSTLVAGSTTLIRELVRTPGIEALPIRTDADLTWDGDLPNRPE